MKLSNCSHWLKHHHQLFAVVVVTDVEVENVVSCVPAVLVDTSCDKAIVDELIIWIQQLKIIFDWNNGLQITNHIFELVVAMSKCSQPVITS